MHSALVVDNHPFIRSSVRMLLATEGFAEVFEADNGVEAVRLARELKPDLIVLDINLPRLDGLEVIARISDLPFPNRTLVLTSQKALFYSVRCMNAGAAGFISKSNELDELAKAVRALMDGYTFFPNLAHSSVRRSDLQKSELLLIQSLTNRELSILQHLAGGMNNKQIGETLLISNKTVSTYKSRLIEKLNVKSVVYLADFAKRNRLV